LNQFLPLSLTHAAADRKPFLVILMTERAELVKISAYGVLPAALN
jgi:hypothetical protein